MNTEKDIRAARFTPLPPGNHGLTFWTPAPSGRITIWTMIRWLASKGTREQLRAVAGFLEKHETASFTASKKNGQLVVSASAVVKD